MRPVSGIASLRILGIALSLSLGWTPAIALSPRTPVDQLIHSQWGSNDGAPSDVWAAAQTTDGWVWFGGSHGLVRFDGVSFEHVETEPGSANPSPAVSELRALDSGELVIGYYAGGVAILRGHTFTNYHESRGLDATTVFGIIEDMDRRLWLATRGGVKRFDGQRWESAGADWNLSPGPVDDISIDNQGRVWISTSHDIEYLERGQTTFQHSDRVATSVGFLRSSDGRLWHMSNGDVKVNPLQSASSSPLRSSNSESSYTALFDRDGSLWNSGLEPLERHIFPAGTVPPAHTAIQAHARPQESLKISLVRTLMEDRSGNLWVPTRDDVHLLRDRRVTALDSSRPGKPVPELAGNVMTAKDGTVWVTSQATVSGSSPEDGLWKYDTHFKRVQPQEIPSATHVFQDANRTLWVASWGGLWRLEKGRFVRDTKLPSDFIRNPVVAMADDIATGSLWVSVRGAGLFLKQGKGWIRHGNIVGLPRTEPSVMAVAPDRTLWLGYLDGRVFRVAGAKVMEVPFNGEARIGAINAIDTSHRILVGGAHGLAMAIEGRLKTLHPEPASGFDGITGILQTANGDVWLNDAMGAVCIIADDLVETRLDADSPVAAMALGPEDGYPGRGADTQGMGSSMTQAHDGRIWVSGLRGLGWFYPSALPRSEEVPLLIRAISTDAGKEALDAPVHLKAGTTHLTIAYTALNYTHPGQQRFRYRLAGFDKNWTDAGNRREAYYTNLPPGRYRFEVVELHETGRWSQTPVAVDFDIAPTLLQTKTFIGLCILAGAIAVLLLIRWRVALLTRRERIRLQEHIDERVGERERIARELHDTLLQGTQGLILTVHSALARARRGEAIEQVLENALASADGAVTESRERIQDLRTATHLSGRLGEALEELGRQLAREADVRFEVVVSGIRRDLDTTVADETFRIGREALSNAFRHAGASTVELKLLYEVDQLRLHIRDDGRGIGADALASGSRPGHWGLPGMRERAQRIAATFDLRSQPGAGTEIELLIEAKTAYAKPPASAWCPPRWWPGARSIDPS